MLHRHKAIHISIQRARLAVMKDESPISLAGDKGPVVRYFRRGMTPEGRSRKCFRWSRRRQARSMDRFASIEPSKGHIFVV